MTPNAITTEPAAPPETAGLVPSSVVGRMRSLGLSDSQARMYDVLLAAGPLSPVELAKAAAVTSTDVLADLEAMADIGLIGGLRSLSSRVRPLPPESAIDLLVRRRELEIKEASTGMLRAFTHYRRTVDTDGSRGLLEVERGSSVIDRVRMLERSVRRRVRGLDCPPYHAGTGVNEIEMENLSRGIVVQQVYAGEAIEQRPYVQSNIRPAMAAGEEARVLSHVPVKLLIIDDVVAIVSLTAADTDVGHSALVLRRCSLLSALIGLWEMCWHSAVPLQLDGSPAEAILTPVETRFLRLLSTGVSDEQVAKVLGISRRTFFRYLEQLMARTGTGTRFQLAAHASRQGWI
jgi:DNA-binding CsgD family transcriptional regulator